MRRVHYDVLFKYVPLALSTRFEVDVVLCLALEEPITPASQLENHWLVVPIGGVSIVFKINSQFCALIHPADIANQIGSS